MGNGSSKKVLLKNDDDVPKEKRFSFSHNHSHG
jgi:hypothetical protein